MSVVKVDDISRLNDVIDSNETVIVNFTAPGWCVPCRRLEPHFANAAEQDDSGAVWVMVDASEPTDVIQGILDEYAVMSVPTVKLFRNGEFSHNVESRTAVTLMQSVS